MVAQFRFVILSLVFFSPLLWRGAGGDVYAQLLDSSALLAQPIYDNMEDALKIPDQVYRLDLRRKKLKVFPKEILQFKNLQELNLGRNQLRELPDEIGELTNMQVLNVSSNKLEYFPGSVGKLKNLKKIIAGKNNLMEIPKQIGELENLEILDLWNNQISVFPEEMNKLKNLRWMDLRVIQIEDDVQKRIREMLPKTTIHFSPSCHCVSG